MLEDAANKNNNFNLAQYNPTLSLKQFDENILETEEIKYYIEHPSKAH